MFTSVKIYKSFSVLAVAVVLFTAVGEPSTLRAQATAAISGTVTDPSGAAIGGATIQVKNTGTNLTRTTTSDEVGRFRVPDLGIGEYDVEASTPGFQSVAQKVTLTVGSNPVVDFRLPVGESRETVLVAADVSLVETQSTAVAALVEGKQITELPLNGRNFTQLVTLAPGVTQIPLGAPGAGNTFYGNGQKYSIAGSRPSGQAYLLDDQDMVNFWNNGPGAGGLGTALGVEAIAEFQTLTNTYSAQFGGNGAVINASSRSGTNALHGSAYEFLRNDKLEARNFFDTVIKPGKTTAEPPTYHQNQFGGSLGGPIKKDKAFFFTNYEGLRKKQIVTAVVTVPDSCAHQFLTITASGVCGTAITENSNPGVRQAVRNAMALYPLPNYTPELFGATGAASGTGQALVDNPNIGTQDYFLGRFDYQ
ncbi:MAG TPA: carboxypeptidase-like regulatory domain-containing protein, partial [Terriglobia bacterium]|nr:carboxypeptidase-like regulatory domain-containing protein [Terriglobia bacterium]